LVPLLGLAEQILADENVDARVQRRGDARGGGALSEQGGRDTCQWRRRLHQPTIQLYAILAAEVQVEQQQVGTGCRRRRRVGVAAERGAGAAAEDADDRRDFRGILDQKQMSHVTRSVRDQGGGLVPTTWLRRSVRTVSRQTP